MSSDDIGNRGEAIFRLLMTDFHIINGVAKPLFSMAFLGEKWPTVDYLVEINDATKAVVPLFLVQVKTTRQGFTSLVQFKQRRSFST